MLTHAFDYTVASYHKLSDVVLEEVLQADIIEIREYVKGGIYHSDTMNWFGSLRGVESPKDMIRSKKERKVIEENKKWFEDQGYTFQIVKMNKNIFDEFYELYQHTTLKRERPLSFPIREQILGKVFIEMPVYLIGMYKGEQLESGLVFSVTEEKQVVVSFGAKKKFPEKRGGVGGVLEYMLIEYCLKHGIHQITHGKSKSPAGITSKSGVFEFKGRYGFSAFPGGFWKTTFIVNPKIALSDLVFVTIVGKQVGYLVVTDNKSEKVAKKYQTREISVVKQVTFDEVKRAGELFVRKIKRG